MFAAAKETYHQNPRILLSACALLPSYQPCHALAARSLANTAHYCHPCRRRHDRFPYLEAQTR